MVAVLATNKSCLLGLSPYPANNSNILPGGEGGGGEALRVDKAGITGYILNM